MCASSLSFFACLLHKKRPSRTKSPLPPVTQADLASNTQLSLKRCLDGSFVHVFQSCGDEPNGRVEFRPFVCKGGERIHYSLLCDGVNDCGEASDEEGCASETFYYDARLFECRRSRSVHVIPLPQRCDGRPDCFDGSDEEKCEFCADGLVLCLGWGCVPQHYVTHNVVDCIPTSDDVIAPLHTAHEEEHDISSNAWRDMTTPGLLHLDGLGVALWSELTPGSPCPETHIQCESGLCIPSYLVNNGIFDCPPALTTEEEQVRDVLSVGYYRCYRWSVRLHPKYLCDGIYQCPLKDDERYCNLTCPQSCTCEGHAFKCSQVFDVDKHPLLRYLDLSGVFRPKLYKMQNLDFLKLLNLSSCGLTQLPRLPWFVSVLDLSFNQLTIQTLADNTDYTFYLLHLDLSGNMLGNELNENFSSQLPSGIFSLESLNLSYTGIRAIKSNSFKDFTELQVLDVRNNKLTVERGAFTGTAKLRTLLADEQRVCCLRSSLYPEAKTDCIAPVDELSTCSDLLRSDFFRAVLWVLCMLALIGNVGVMAYRLCVETGGTSSSYRVLVTNLCMSDLLMGVYLQMVGWADAHYKGDYLWKRDEWTHSVTCRAAGFLALVSSEVSALLICLITLDRLLVLSLPLKRHLHIETRGALLTCGGAWLAGVGLALIPLTITDWQFYGQTGICLPLPITSHNFPGNQYAFGIFIVLNFLLFLAVGAGQVLIYRAISVTSQGDVSGRRQQDVAIARRLALVVLSDFSCWFPIGLLGLLASQGVPVPGVVTVWMAILVLPINSAINPFLYTLGFLLERRARRREEQRIQTTLGRIHAAIVTWPVDKLEDLCLHAERALQRARELRRREEERRATSSV